MRSKSISRPARGLNACHEKAGECQVCFSFFIEVELDFGRGISGAVETEILHAPALDSREAHITTSRKTDLLKQGKCTVIVPRATGLSLTLT
jgi:hypothetical protein